jgi:hypothetical protein
VSGAGGFGQLAVPDRQPLRPGQHHPATGLGVAPLRQDAREPCLDRVDELGGDGGSGLSVELSVGSDRAGESFGERDLVAAGAAETPGPALISGVGAFPRWWPEESADVATGSHLTEDAQRQFGLFLDHEVHEVVRRSTLSGPGAREDVSADVVPPVAPDADRIAARIHAFEDDVHMSRLGTELKGANAFSAPVPVIELVDIQGFDELNHRFR